MSTVRRAKQQDLDRLLRLALALHSESPVFQNIPVDLQRLRVLLANAVDTRQSRAIALISVGPNQIDGMLIGAVAEYFFSRECYGADLMFYVAQPARRTLVGGRVAMRLLQEFTRWAKAAGARELRMGISTGISDTSVERLFRSAGMAPAGNIFSKRLQ